MPYPKRKSENYTEIGGINTKVSNNVTPKTDVLDLDNLDFSIPGALSPRPGFTNGLVGNTLTVGRLTTQVEIVDPTFGPQHLFGGAAALYGYSYTAGFFFYGFTSALTNANWFSSSLFDSAYFANGTDFVKFRFFVGSSTSPFARFGQLAPDAASYSGVVGFSQNIGGATFTAATLTYYLAFGDNINFNPSDNVSIFAQNQNFIGPITGPYYRSVGLGATGVQVSGISIPSANVPYGPNRIFLLRQGPSNYASTDLVVVDESPLNVINLQDTHGNSVLPTTEPNVGRVYEEPVSPTQYSGAKYLEFFKNVLFIAGDGNKVIFGEINDPQNIQPENFFLVGNGTFNTRGLKTYQQSLLIGLSQGIYRLTGDNVDNYSLEVISTEYGFISHKALVNFKDVCWFLDRRGIVEFNGSQFHIVSDKIEPIIKRINFTAAADTAVGFYFKERNEVWFSVPLDTSTIPNMILIYDIVADSWTKFSGTGLNPTTMGYLYKGTSSINYDMTKDIYFGTTQGTLNYFGSTFTSDAGASITYRFWTRFHTEGESVQMQWRRFFLNVAPVRGVTQMVQSSFYVNGITGVISMTRGYNVGATFQTRLEFGVPAKSFSVETFYSSATTPIGFPGYTIESRYQRNV